MSPIMNKPKSNDITFLAVHTNLMFQAEDHSLSSLPAVPLYLWHLQYLIPATSSQID